MPNSALGRLLTAVFTGVLIGLPVGMLANVRIGVLAGIACAAAVFVVSGWFAFWPMDAEKTRLNARREDFGPGIEEARRRRRGAVRARRRSPSSCLGHSAGQPRRRGDCGGGGIHVMGGPASDVRRSVREPLLLFRCRRRNQFQLRRSACLPRLPLLQLQPGNDVPGFGHLGLELRRSGPSCCVTVFCRTHSARSSSRRRSTSSSGSSLPTDWG